MKRNMVIFSIIIGSIFPNCLISREYDKKVITDVKTYNSTSDKWIIDFESKATYFRDYMFVLKCRSLIYDFNSKKISIPVFKGNGKELNYNDFYIFYKKKKIYMINNQAYSAFIIPCRQGVVKKTFHEFLNFYRTNIFKGIDVKTPVNMVIDGAMWVIDYNFTVDGIPCSMTIQIVSDESDIIPVDKWKTYRSVFQINPKENGRDKYFFYSINIGEHVRKVAVKGQNLGVK